MLVLTIGPWCLVQWSRAGSRAASAPVTAPGSSALVVRTAAYLFSGTWHANLAGGLLWFSLIVALLGVQSLVNLISVKIWERIQGQAWEYAGTSPDSKEFWIDGINVWEHKWQGLQVPKAGVLGQNREFRRVPIYEIVADGTRITFGADECSARTWGFWRPRAGLADRS